MECCSEFEYETPIALLNGWHADAGSELLL